MAKGESLGLPLPPQTEPGEGAFNISPRPLAAWISQLPVANIGDTTKQLYQALHTVNRQSHEWKRRLHFLEAIRPPLDTMQRALDRRYTGLSFPLPAKTLQVAKLSQRLHVEMAVGYIAAIEGMFQTHFLFHDRHALKVMVHRASRHLNLGLLSCYQVYCQHHAGIWQQLHRLYAFAEARNFHQTLIKDPLYTDLPKSSIARIYKQIALLAAASPHRLHLGEAAAVHKALARWAAHAQVLKIAEGDDTGALFVLHLHSDEEPAYRTLDHRPCAGNACRLIDTRQFISVIREEAHGANGAPTSLLTPELYRRLLHSWENAPTRSERRNEGGDGIDVVIGMAQIHRVLAPAQQSPAAGPPTAPIAKTPPPAQANATAQARRASDDPWNPYARSERKPVPAATSSQPAESATLISRWQIINESVGGFRLAVPEGQEAAIRVGEALAMRELHAPDRWHLTVVRWIRHSDQTLFEAGVQIIASDTVPVLVKNLSPGKDKGECQRGLLLPELAERGLPPSLFLPNRLFAPAEKVLLHVSGTPIEIVLGKAIQDSGSFVQFEFQPREKIDNVPVGSADGAPFETLWGQL